MRNYTDFSDEELIKRFKQDDDRAFAELVERYKKTGFSLAYNMTGSIEDAEDISQNGFVLVYKNLKGFRFDSSFKTWFFRILINLCKRHHRKNKLMSYIPLGFFAKEGGGKEIEFRIDADPEAELSAKQTNSKITDAVKCLPLKQREVFVMKHIEGMKIIEIAHLLDCAEGTVKTHLFRAVKELQERLKGFL